MTTKQSKSTSRNTVDDKALRDALSQYQDALKAVSESKRIPGVEESLLELDKWYRSALVDRPSASAEELTKLARWKLSREKWRPRLLALVASNPANEVDEVTTEALAEQDTMLALKTLTRLKGVGPATASALLAAVKPRTNPFQSDELVQVLELGKPEYTVKFYQRYLAAVEARMQKGDWTADDLEKAAWAHCHSSIEAPAKRSASPPPQPEKKRKVSPPTAKTRSSTRRRKE